MFIRQKKTNSKLQLMLWKLHVIRKIVEFICIQNEHVCSTLSVKLQSDLIYCQNCFDCDGICNLCVPQFWNDLTVIHKIRVCRYTVVYVRYCLILRTAKKASSYGSWNQSSWWFPYDFCSYIVMYANLLNRLFGNILTLPKKTTTL